MKNRLVMLAAGLSVVGACSMLESVPKQAALDVHHAYIIPNADFLFAAESEPPKSTAGWQELAERAEVISEAIQKLKTVSDIRPIDGWDEAIDLVSERASAVAAATASRDSLDLVVANGDMLDACASCHAAYRD